MSSDRDMPTMDTAIDALIAHDLVLDAEVTTLQTQGTNADAHRVADAPHAGHELTTNRAKAGGYATLDEAGLVPVAQLPSVTVQDATVEHTTNKAAANGYAGLGANSLVPVDQLGTGTPNGTKFLRDDQVYAVPVPAGALTGNVPLYIWKGGALNFTQNTTRFFKALNTAATTTEADATFAMPIRCRVSELRVQGNANIGGSAQTLTTTVRKGKAGGAMADTAITCTINTGAAAGNDTTHTVDYEIGDLFSVKGVASATTGSTIDFGVTCLITALEGDHAAGAAGIPFILISAGSAMTANDFLGEWTESATETLMQIPMSACRVFHRAWSRLSGGTSAVMLPGLTISLNATLATPPGATVLGDGAGNFSGAFQLESGSVVECADNDLVAMKYAGVGVPTHADAAFRLQNTDATKYAPIPFIFNSSAQAQALTRYMGSFGVGVESATESEVQIPMPACTIRNLRAVSDSAPAAGQTLTQTVRKNGVDTAVTCQITSAGRQASDVTNSVTFAAGDLFSISNVSSATSGTRTCTAAVEAFLT